MAALSLSEGMGIGAVLFVVQAVSVALGRALRTYSRSRLELVCVAVGKSDRTREIERDDEATERAAEGIAVLVELLATAWLTRTLAQLPILGAVGTAVAATIIIHSLASVVGRVWAESLLAHLWPLAGFIRRIAWPLSTVAVGVEWLGYHLAGPADAPPRPTSVEVEIPPDSDHPVDNEGDVSVSTRILLEHVVGLTRLSVFEIMTPRSAIKLLPATASPQAAARTFRETGLSRIPLFGEHRDDIVGILYAKDLYPLLVDPTINANGVVPAKIARKPHFVPESKNANDLLGELRTLRSQIALVVDEYGTLAGLVTLEDLFEQLVGPIDDEHDIPTSDNRIKAVSPTKFEVDATVPLGQLNQRFHLHLPTDGQFQTLGGYAFNELGRLPSAGEMFQANGVQITILEVVEKSIRRVLMELQ